jgi:phosphatidylethanolamine N-methyltransferase
VLETEPETETETERVPPPKPKRRPLTSQHDLLAYYFRKDTLGLHNFDAFRAADFQLLLLLIYAVGLAVLPAPGGPRAFFVHALGWTLFNTFGLGLLLRAQGERKALVRHFVQHYHYPAQDGARGAVREAFANWKQLYNTSMCMTYGARFQV